MGIYITIRERQGVVLVADYFAADPANDAGIGMMRIRHVFRQYSHIGCTRGTIDIALRMSRMTV